MVWRLVVGDNLYKLSKFISYQDGYTFIYLVEQHKGTFDDAYLDSLEGPDIAFPWLYKKPLYSSSDVGVYGRYRVPGVFLTCQKIAP